MEQVYIKTADLTSWLAKKYFEGLDIISVGDLVYQLENTTIALENCQDDFDSFKQNVQENYKQVPISDQIGYDPTIY